MNLKNRNVLTDGSFSQRRDAQNAFVPFMSATLLLVLHIEVGNQKKEGKTANEMENHLTVKGLRQLREFQFPVLGLSSFHEIRGERERKRGERWREEKRKEYQ